MRSATSNSRLAAAAGTRQPLLYAALAFSAGTLIGARLWRPPTWWTIAILAFSLACLYFLRYRAGFSAVLGLTTVALLGAFLIELRGSGTANPGDIIPFTDGSEIVLTAHVIQDGTLREGGFGGIRQTLDIETDQATSATGSAASLAGVRLNLYSREQRRRTTSAALQPSMPLFRYGQRLRLKAKLRPPRNFRNPGAFDYAEYLARNGIVALGSADISNVELLPGFIGSKITLLHNRIRGSVLGMVHRLWPPPQAALIDAMVIGEDSFLDRDTRVDFQRSGTYHILVVSGMNLGILAFVVFWCLRRLHVGELAACIATALLAFGYAYLCNLGAPILRSAFMLTLYLGARLLYRDRSPLNTLGGAALALLVIDPPALLDASFQLTFLSVLAIAGIGLPLLERTSQPYRHALRALDASDYDIKFEAKLAQFRLDVRMIGERLRRFAGAQLGPRLLPAAIAFALGTYEVILISALMQVALALPMSYYFHRATTLALPANSLVVPLTELLMPASVLAVGLGYVWLGAARLPAALAGLALDGITRTVHLLGQVRLADLRVATPDLLPAVAAAVAFAAAMLLVRRRALLAWIGLAALTASAVWITAIPPRPRVYPGSLEITAIDVGQGDSTLLVMPDGKTLLVDGGGPLGPWQSEFDYGEDVVSPYLWTRRISRLDAVVLTHGHADHIGGLHAVINNFRPRELWLGPNPHTRAVDELMKVARLRGVTVVRRVQGDAFTFGGADLRVLSPPSDWVPKAEPQNNDSLALKFTHAKTSFLMEGDAEKKMERTIATEHPRANLLKIAHNGSNTSTSPELLAAVEPQLAIISVGPRNPFRHPRGEVLARLQALHVHTYRTDLDGAVSFFLDGNSVTVRTGTRR